MKKTKVACYRIDLELQSPLTIGAAQSSLTDYDVVLDSRGLPVIPATSIAGVLRSCLADDKAEQYFGKRISPTDGDSPDAEVPELTESVIRTYDATWQDTNMSVSVRDNVALKKDDKVADDGLKFDRQVVESGAVFRTYLDITDEVECPASEVEHALYRLHSGSVLLGGKSTRGMGRVIITDCRKRLFDLSEPKELDSWLRFNAFESSSWSGCDNFLSQIEARGKSVVTSDIVITLKLSQRGGISVREYSTEPGMPDFTQLYQRDSAITDPKEWRPVIPGTSWAGAFRSRYRHIVSDLPNSAELVDELFGYVKRVPDKETNNGDEKARRQKTVQQCSRIEFSESVIKDGVWKEITRNSIDRYTGGTLEHALFTLRTYFDGQTDLAIRICCEDGDWDEEVFRPLIISIADLHNGFLSVGGLTAVGHGLFAITDATCSICGKPYDDFGRLLLNPCDLDGELIVPAVTEIAQHLAEEVTHGK